MYVFFAQASGSGFSFLPLLLIIIVFYFFMIRPNAKRMKEQKRFIGDLKKGDKVITNSGIYGKVMEITDATVLLQVDKSTNLTFDKNSISAQASNALQKAENEQNK